jgi:hypothetical protein
MQAIPHVKDEEDVVRLRMRRAMNTLLVPWIRPLLASIRYRGGSGAGALAAPDGPMLPREPRGGHRAFCDLR